MTSTKVNPLLVFSLVGNDELLIEIDPKVRDRETHFSFSSFPEDGELDFSRGFAEVLEDGFRNHLFHATS